MNEETNNNKLEDEDLDQVAGGGNVEGGTCKYCNGTDINGEVRQFHYADGSPYYKLVFYCNNPACSHYGQDPWT